MGIAQQLAEDYNWPGMPTVSELGRGRNRNFAACAGEVRVHVRVYRAEAHPEGIACELEVLAALRSTGAPVCAPILRRDGRLFGDLDLDGGTHLYAAFEFADGEPPRSWTSQLAEACGAAVGMIHASTSAMSVARRRVTLDVTALAAEPTAALLATAPDTRATGLLLAISDEVAVRLSVLGSEPSSWGFIHADLHAGNMHATEDGVVRIFDFDSCAQGPRALDLALCWMTIPATEWPDFLVGYRTHREPSTDELSAIPVLAKARMISDFASSLRDSSGRSGYWSHSRLGQIFSRIDERRAALGPHANG